MNFALTLDVTADSEQAVTAFAVKHLRDRGYNVAEPNAVWERPGEFLKRVGLSKSFELQSAIRTWKRRSGTVMSVHGLSGRVRELLSNPAFDGYCRRRKP